MLMGSFLPPSKRLFLHPASPTSSSFSFSLRASFFFPPLSLSPPPPLHSLTYQHPLSLRGRSAPPPLSRRVPFHPSASVYFSTLPPSSAALCLSLCLA